MAVLDPTTHTTLNGADGEALGVIKKTGVTAPDGKQIGALLVSLVNQSGVDQSAALSSIDAKTPNGIVTTVTAAAVAVTATSGVALAANANRVSAVFTNNGASDITLRRGTPAVFGQGIILKALGGRYEINSTNLYRGGLTCICDTAASSTLAVEEGV